MLKRIMIFVLTVMLTSLVGGSIIYLIEKIRTKGYTEEQIHLHPPSTWLGDVATMTFFTLFALLIYYMAIKLLPDKYHLHFLKRCIIGSIATLIGFLLPFRLIGYKLSVFDAQAWIRIVIFVLFYGFLITLITYILNRLFSNTYKKS